MLLKRILNKIIPAIFDHIYPLVIKWFSFDFYEIFFTKYLDLRCTLVFDIFRSIYLIFFIFNYKYLPEVLYTVNIKT